MPTLLPSITWLLYASYYWCLIVVSILIIFAHISGYILYCYIYLYLYFTEQWIYIYMCVLLYCFASLYNRTLKMHIPNYYWYLLLCILFFSLAVKIKLLLLLCTLELFTLKIYIFYYCVYVCTRELWRYVSLSYVSFSSTLSFHLSLCTLFLLFSSIHFSRSHFITDFLYVYY